MRYLLVAFTLTVSIGCGSSSGNGNADAGGNGNGTGTGGNGATGDMSVTVKGGGDMSAAATCDVGAQTGCAAGQKCVPEFSGGNGVTGTCVTDGTAAIGQPCTPGDPNSNTITDNCVGGAMCDNSGVGSTYTCHKVCSGDSACDSGSRCGSIFNNANYGLCYATCTAFGSGCPAGNDCSVPFDDLSATQSSEVGFFVCKKTGTATLFASCSGDSDCAAGFACDPQSGCYPICDTSHACPILPADGGTLTCYALVSQANGAGYCY